MQTITHNDSRGFLSNCPPDVVAIINGQPITRTDILRGKQERQARRLAQNRQSFEDVFKPGFVWVFDNGPIFPYGGKWLYVRTLKHKWQIRDDRTRLLIMSAFPCGLLPMIENYKLWQQTFINFYHRPDSRPQGLAVCWIKLNYNEQVIGVFSGNRVRE